uniref:Uncharacterized protein n=1 Tax=Candidozyma auris TaxID=498019 RepID=A0A0L0NSE1_CANAR
MEDFAQNLGWVENFCWDRRGWQRLQWEMKKVFGSMLVDH